MPLDFLLSAQIATAIFWAILFLQSGLDKVFDWSGNLNWLKGHFEKTPLGGIVPAMLGSVTLVELAAGVLSAFGAVMLFLEKDTQMAQYGVQLSLLALLMLFFGQRLAKDYEGAASLAMYFGVGLVSVLILS